MYTKKVMEHFQKPQNYGKLKNPDGVGKVGNIVCGDVMWLYIKVGENKKGEKIISNIKFQTFGCVAAIATSSTITQLVKGKTLTAALEIDKEAVIESLGTLPPVKIHCSVLAADALVEAVYDYLVKTKQSIPQTLAKKHQKLVKEKQIIDEKYKDWVKTEEEILKHE